ncbi:MAG: hypothetical protein EZS28_000651, partial [Streblomastix strix]
MGNVVYKGADEIHLRIFPWLETTAYNAVLTYNNAVIRQYPEQPTVGQDFWFCAKIQSI